MKKIKRSAQHFTTCIAAVAAIASLSSVSAQSAEVVDKTGKIVGSLLATNTVLIRAGKQHFAVKFKEPGFDTFTEIDQSVITTAYFESGDCSGTMYYSDQADGKWKRNLTPSVYDIPTTGIAIGVTPSDEDKNYFQKVDVSFPAGEPTTVTVKSKKILGESRRPSECFDVTPVSDVFWAMRKITFEAQPPFRLK